MKLSEIAIGSPLSLRVSLAEKSMRIDAIMKKHISDKSALISLQTDSDKKLNFSTVRTDMEYYPDGNVPIKWVSVNIISYENDYLIQVSSEGTKNNRRHSFRVGVSESAKLDTVIPNCPRSVTIRDVSLSGFSISDRKGELPFQIGNTVSVSWEDFGHMLNLTGRLVRIENRPDVTIFGFEICNICKDLSSYLNKKQRQQRDSKKK